MGTRSVLPRIRGQSSNNCGMKNAALIVISLSLGAAFSISPRTITTDLAKPSVCSRYSSGFSGALANRNIQWADNIATEKYMGVGKRGLGRLRAELDVKEPGLQQKSVAQSGDTKGFEWTRQWYPVAVVRDLEAMDPRQPYPVKLLGESYVVWKDPKDGGWKAFTDRCPHRWAPLSEGRVDQGTGRLQCIYHGWEFEGDGKCGNIPQASPSARDNAQNSRRACATVIPTKIVQEKLWLWPDSSPEGFAASELTSPVVLPDMDREEFGGNWYMRELEYGYDSLVENLCDPAHVPFAHHGTLLTRKMGEISMDIKMEAGLGPDELKTQNTGYMGQKNMQVGFKAPSLAYYRSDYTELLPVLLKRLPRGFQVLAWIWNKLNLDKNMSLAMKGELGEDPSNRLLFYFVAYAVPTTPGKSRIFTRTARNFFLQHPVIPRRWRNSLAQEHLQQHLVLDGDSAALHVLERELVKKSKQWGKDAERTFYMPTDADAPVRAVRKWLNSRGGGGPPWAPGVNPVDLGAVLPHEKLLDRLDSHTKHCSACAKAYSVSGYVKRLAAGAAVLLLAGAAVAPRGVVALWLTGSALGSSALALFMRKREHQYVFLDYQHAILDG